MSTERGTVLQEGLWVGLTGYATTVVTVALMDWLAGRSPFYTPALLGGALFGADGRPGAVAIRPDIVFPYNGVHLLVFLALGLLIAVLVREVELHPALWYVAFFTILGTFFLAVFAVGSLARSAGFDVPWGTILVANGAAALAIFLYLGPRHPDLWLSVLRGVDEEAPS